MSTLVAQHLSFFIGGPAHSAFRLTRVRTSLLATLPDPGALASTWVYVVSSSVPLSPGAESRLGQLLDARRIGELFPANDALYVMPRTGTLSPWSSKATDIAHHCGLGEVC